MASQVSVEAAADAWTRLGSFHERVCEKTDRKRAKVAGNCRNFDSDALALKARR